MGGKPIVFLAFLALPGMSQASPFPPRLSLETLINYPLLPDFYETANFGFVGLGVSFPVHPRLDLQAGMSLGLPYLDMPMSDLGYTQGSTRLFHLGAEAGFLNIGVARLFTGAGFGFAASRWSAGNLAYDDPGEPREYWSGSLSILDFRIAPGLELFREDAGLDWSMALSLPFFVPIWRNLESGGDEKFFRNAYLRDAGFGIGLSIRLGI